MNLIKNNSQFHHSGFFDDFFNRSLSDIVGADFTVSQPSVNILEEEDKYIVEVAAPGVDKKDFNIEVDKNQLIISANREEEKEEVEGKMTRNEFNFSSFTRKFILPDTVDTDSIDATYKEGILIISLGKKEAAKAKAPLNVKIK